MVDRDAATTQRALEQHGIVTLVGDATEREVLRRRRGRRAPTWSSPCSIATPTTSRWRSCARRGREARDGAHARPRATASVYEAAGVHQILSETEILVGALATAIEFEAVRHSMVLGGGESIAFEIVLPPEARSPGMTVSEIAADPGFPPSCVFAGDRRERGRGRGSPRLFGDQGRDGAAPRRPPARARQGHPVSHAHPARREAVTLRGETPAYFGKVSSTPIVENDVGSPGWQRWSRPSPGSGWPR